MTVSATTKSGYHNLHYKRQVQEKGFVFACDATAPVIYKL